MTHRWSCLVTDDVTGHIFFFFFLFFWKQGVLLKCWELFFSVTVIPAAAEDLKHVHACRCTHTHWCVIKHTHTGDLNDFHLFFCLKLLVEITCGSCDRFHLLLYKLFCLKWLLKVLKAPRHTPQ